MSERDICAAVREFGRVIKSSERLCKGGTRLAHILSAFYSMRCAFSIRVLLGEYDKGDAVTKAASLPAEGESLAHFRLPSFDAVQAAIQEFTTAETSGDGAGMSSALERMEVFGLCPIPEMQLSRMELVAGYAVGRAHLIPLVELALFAAELEDYESAGRYDQEARALDPSAWELYTLCIVSGLIALNAGKNREAIQFLDRSIKACQTDEYASLNCGVRAPNLLLADKLLERGERVEVLKHLLDCRDVWQFYKLQIDNWVSLIEGGEAPQFQNSGMLRAMNQPSYKLQMQWVRACSLGEGSGSAAPKSTTPKSPAEVLAGRERLRAEYKNQMDAAIKGELGTTNS